jgi:hypothetical protein
MQIEIPVSLAAATATYHLIQEYLAKGGTGLDAAALAEMLAALGAADRIIIASE